MNDQQASPASQAAHPVVATPADPLSKRGVIIQTLREQLKDCDSALELGAGHFEMIGALGCRTRVGVEIHEPYIDRRICDRFVVPIRAEALTACKMFPSRSFDAVLLVDFIEHLKKETALTLLAEAERIARKIVYVHCPVGRHPQEGDAFGLGGDEYQRHRSEWHPEEFITRG